MQNLGLIHIYCGEGKGKTTASLGLALRAAGRGFNVVILQFLKGMVTGELASLAMIPNIKLFRGKELPTFSFKMTDQQKREATTQHNKAFENVIDYCKHHQIDLLILDEVIGAYEKNLIDRDMVINFIDNKPPNLELVLTGRYPAAELIERADYISRIAKEKHPFDKGIKARIGVER